MLKKVLFLISAVISVFAMNSAELNINNKDLEVSARVDLSNISYSINPDTMLLGVRFLNGDEEHSDNDNANLDPFFEVNFLMTGEVNYNLTLGLGIKANHTKDFTSIPLGIEAIYQIPQDSFIPIYLGGAFYFAPSVLTYEDGDNFAEYRLNVDFEVIPNGLITLGYRKIETDYDDKRGDFTYNSSFYGGFKIRF